MLEAEASSCSPVTAADPVLLNHQWNSYSVAFREYIRAQAGNSQRNSSKYENISLR